MKHIRASYIMFVDADDKLPEGAVESLMRSALRTDADIVEGGYTALWENVRLLLSGIREFYPGLEHIVWIPGGESL